MVHSSDSKVCSLQVTNSTDRSMVLRCLMSSADSGKNFDLRCHARERLIAHIQKNYPESLPRVRTDIKKASLVFGVPEQRMASMSLPAMCCLPRTRARLSASRVGSAHSN